MLRFTSDYMEGCHPAILEKLQAINFDKNTGYGLDPYCDSARAKIREACQCPDANVQFLVGGTQTNMLIIDAMLRYNEGIIACATGHINVHESGAIEACGHKVMPVKGTLGKIDLPALRQYLEAFYRETSEVGIEHYVMPRAIYLSFPTELGTLYTLAELQELRELASQYGLFLMIDGARLGYGLAASSEVTLPELARMADAFYIGGTKVGAMFGEAVVVPHPAIELTRGLIKRRGALLAKGWLLGVQFDTLFTDGLYEAISRNAISRAMAIKTALVEKGYSLYIDSPTNQQFVVMSNQKMDELSEAVQFDYISPFDETRSVVRFATSWATTSEQVEALATLL